MKNNRDDEEEEVEENPDDYCFVCKAGGELIICDYENCTKSYHLGCVGKDESFLENDTDWKCDWHTCFICHKPTEFGCFLCPQAQCRSCIHKVNFVLVRNKKGFCSNCLKLALLVEEDKDFDSDGEKVDFEDLESFEGLFKDIWPIFNKKEGFTAKDLRDADDRLKKGLNYNRHADSDNDAGDQEKRNRDHKRKRSSKKSNKEEIFTVNDLQDADVQLEKGLNYNPYADSDNDSKDQVNRNRDQKRRRNSKESNEKEIFTVNDHQDADVRLRKGLNYNPRQDSDNDADDQEKRNRDHKTKNNSKKSNKKEFSTVNEVKDADSDNDGNDQEKRKQRDNKRKSNSKKSNEKEYIGWGSKSLIHFLESIGKKPSGKLSQDDVWFIISAYIKQKKLIDPQKRKKVICDEKLTKFLGRKYVNKYSIRDLLDSHLAENIEKSDEEKTYKKQRNLNIIDKPTSENLQLVLVFADIVEENMKLVYLRKSLLEQLAEEDEFERKVIGSFVRVKSDSKNGIEKITRQLMQVTGIKRSLSAENDANIVLQVSDMPNDICISMLSDADFSKEECKDLKRRIKDGLLRRITIDELTQKAAILHEDITNHWIERELVVLQNHIELANEKGWRSDLCGYLERRKLLETPAEQSRLLNRAPTVTPDISDSIQITNNLEDDDDDDDDDDDGEKEEKRSPKPVLVGSSSKILVDHLEANQTSFDPKKSDEDEVVGHRSAEKPGKKQRNLNKTDKGKVKSKNKNNKEKLNTPRLFFADVVEENVKLVYLRKSLLEELAKNDEFEKKVIGSFVRVRSDSKDGIKRHSHQLMEITGIKKSLSGNSDSGILLQLSGTPNDVHISMLSDEYFSEDECKELKQKIKDGLHRKLTIVELEKKAVILHEDITKHCITGELVLLQKRIDHANEKGWRKECTLSEHLKKKELLSTPAEQSRLLNKAPVVIPDVSDLEPILQTSSQKAILITATPENLSHNLQGNQTCSGDDADDRDGNEQATNANHAAKVTGGLVADESNQRDTNKDGEGAEKNKQGNGDTHKYGEGKKRGEHRPQPLIVNSF